MVAVGGLDEVHLVMVVAVGIHIDASLARLVDVCLRGISE
jgi:hypothetical protein